MFDLLFSARLYVVDTRLGCVVLKLVDVQATVLSSPFVFPPICAQFSNFFACVDTTFLSIDMQLFL